jgi:hypothetical protein
MEIGSIFLILALLLLVGLFVGRPFLADKQSQEAVPTLDQADHERSSLLAERDRLLHALKELDFDYALGKIPEEDYPPQRALLMQQGVEILRKLDALQPDEEPVSAEERLEAAIAARRAELKGMAQPVSGNGKTSSAWVASAVVAAPDDELEVMLSNRRRIRQDKAAGFCPKCGTPLQKSDQFCPKCGARIVT